MVFCQSCAQINRIAAQINRLFAQIFEVFRRFEPNGGATAPPAPASYGYESRDFSYFETKTQDQDLKFKSEVRTRLSKICLETRDRSRELHHYLEY